MTNLQQIKPDGRCVHGLAEYIWLKGNSLRSQTRVIEVNETQEGWNPQLPWLAVTNDKQEVVLSPAHYTDDPVRGEQCYLVLCEVRNADGRNHETNTRAQLRGTLDAGASELVSHWTLDQRFALKSDAPVNRSRELFEQFIRACLQSGLLFGGGRTHEMSGAWAFQMGVRDFDPSDDPLSDPRWSIQAGDHLLFARWILQRLFEDEGVPLVFSPLMAEFSTEMMRHKVNGRGVPDLDFDSPEDSWVGARTYPNLDGPRTGPLRFHEPGPVAGQRNGPTTPR